MSSVLTHKLSGINDKPRRLRNESDSVKRGDKKDEI